MKTLLTIFISIFAIAIIGCSSSKEASDNTQNENGMITTESGLQYEIIKEGTGAKPEKGDMVSVHYTGTFENGEVFDSSVEKGKPFEFKVGTGQVIKGWDEAVIDMRVGEKRKIVVPPNLGYGSRQRGSIPPNSVLIFDVELLDIK